MDTINTKKHARKKETPEERVKQMLFRVCKQHEVRWVLSVLDDYPSLFQQLDKWFIDNEVKVIYTGYEHSIVKPELRKEGSVVYLFLNK